MSFLGGTAFLGWLAAALVPLVVYWLMRRRKTELRWSANLILRRTLARSGRRAFWRQATILALRVLAILLVVLALARPLWPRPAPAGSLPHGEGILHQIILLDNSDSLSIAYQGHTRESELRARLQTLLTRMQAGDVAELIPLAVAPGEQLKPWSVSVPMSPEAWQALDRQLTLHQAVARWQDGLQLAAERFHVTSSQNRHLVLLSDFSAADLPPAVELGRFAPVFAGLGVRLAGYHLQDRERPNLEVHALQTG